MENKFESFGEYLSAIIKASRGDIDERLELRNDFTDTEEYLLNQIVIKITT